MKDIYEFDGKQYWNTAKVGAEYDIAPITVAAWRKRGLLPRGIRLGRIWYFDIDEVRQTISKGE